VRGKGKGTIAETKGIETTRGGRGRGGGTLGAGHVAARDIDLGHAPVGGGTGHDQGRGKGRGGGRGRGRGRGGGRIHGQGAEIETGARSRGTGTGTGGSRGAGRERDAPGLEIGERGGQGAGIGEGIEGTSATGRGTGAEKRVGTRRREIRGKEKETRGTLKDLLLRTAIRMATSLGPLRPEIQRLPKAATSPLACPRRLPPQRRPPPPPRSSSFPMPDPYPSQLLTAAARMRAHHRDLSVLLLPHETAVRTRQLRASLPTRVRDYRLCHHRPRSPSLPRGPLQPRPGLRPSHRGGLRGRRRHHKRSQRIWRRLP